MIKPISPPRRRLLTSLVRALPIGAAAAIPFPSRADALDYPVVIAGAERQFPRDFGAHPAYRTEWWYLTAWLKTSRGPMGLQLTFFRSRTPYGRLNPSRFAATQLYFAHAAIADPRHARLLHAEQAWRGGTAIASARNTDTDVRLGRPHRLWSLRRSSDDRYLAQVNDPLFDFRLSATPAHAKPVLQGDAGFSLKGVRDEQASYYYSRPQLDLQGSLTFKPTAQLPGKPEPLPFTGTGWLDHEWSSELLAPQAQGWDWTGINLFDGRALMAFQMRSDDGGVLRTTARLIEADGSSLDLPVEFTPVRTWVSPRTGAGYPVSWRLQAGPLDLRIEPLMADQEIDSRRSTGTIYWEGAVRVSPWQAQKNPGQSVIGRGYLEMTGYAAKMRL